MSRIATVLILFAAAALEAGGDALIRAGLHTNAARSRYLMFGAAAIILFAYGWTVNAPPWEFGKLLGMYIVFFIIAQLLSWLVFKQPPSATVLIGGILIVAGGIVISLAKS